MEGETHDRKAYEAKCVCRLLFFMNSSASDINEILSYGDMYCRESLH